MKIYVTTPDGGRAMIDLSKIRQIEVTAKGLKFLYRDTRTPTATYKTKLIEIIP